MRKRVSIDLNEKNKMDLIKSSKMTLQINKHYGLCLGRHADGIGPWMNQLETGVDFSGKFKSPIYSKLHETMIY